MARFEINYKFLKILGVAIIAIAIAAGSYLRSVDLYELIFLDFRYMLRPTPKISDKIVFIEISDDSFDKIGSWPFERKYHALLIQALKSAGVKQIIFDIFFSETTKDDMELSQAINAAGNVYMPVVFGSPKGRESNFPVSDDYEEDLLKVFQSVCKGTGHINIIPDPDGKFRRIPPIVECKGELFIHMGFLAALDYLGLDKDGLELLPGKYIKAGDLFVPLDNHSNIIINFPGKWVNTFRHYSYVDIITSYLSSMEGEKPLIDLTGLKDAVCYVAITNTAGPDVHASPFESLYPGVGVHASLFNSMITNKFIARAGRAVNIFILVAFLLSTFVVTMRFRKLMGLVYMATLVILFFAFSVIVFDLFGIWVDMFYPLVIMAFFYLALTFKKYIHETQRREILENELSIAKNIQQSFLPKEMPQSKGMHIAAKMRTARQVGGDLYDFVEFSESRIGVMIGDVSGKGVPAALYMAKVVSLFKLFSKEDKVSQSLAKLNHRLTQESGSNLFVTLCYLIVDAENKKLDFSIGGHSPIMMLRNGEGQVRSLMTEEGMPLGVFDGEFGDKSVDIQTGDIFAIYTDGVTEAMDKKNNMYEEARLAALIIKNRDKTAEEIVNRIHEDVAVFEGKDRQHDDITAIIIKIT